MKIRDLSKKIGLASKGFVSIEREGNKLIEVDISTFSLDYCFNSNRSYSLMTVNFFNIGITESGHILITINVK